MIGKTTYRKKNSKPKYDGGGLTPEQQKYLNFGEDADNLAVGALDNLGANHGMYAGNTAAQTAGGALKGAGEGAKLGSAFGAEGAIIGGAAGLIVGGVSSFIGAKNNKRNMDAARFQQQQQITQQNINRSDAELAQYPAMGVRTQYYKKGGFIQGRYNDKNGTYYAFGGGPGGDVKVSTSPITLPANNDPYWKTHPFITQHDDGTFRMWGEKPKLNIQDPEQFRRMIAADYQPASYNPNTPVVNGTGDGANRAMVMQPQVKSPDTIHSTSGYYARGGSLGSVYRPIKRKALPQFPATNQFPYAVTPDELAFNPSKGPDATEYNQLAHGGKIHIKPENKGKFTAYKERTGKTTEEALHSKDPHVRQMANFARNAKKWHHAYGGQIANPDYEVEKNEVVQGNPLLEQSNQLASDMHLVGGQSHENGGTDGIGGDRVFSDRLTVSPELIEILKQAKISLSPNTTYADAAKKLGNMKGKMEDKLKSNYQPSINTANKIIDRADNALDNLFQDQEMQKAVQVQKPARFAKGGMIPKRYDSGGDIPIESYQQYAKQMGVPDLEASGTTSHGLSSLSNEIQPYQVELPNITPDVHPSFGQSVLDFANNNKGEITNFANYLSNLGAIRGLNTNVNRSYVAPPTYNYVDRSAEGIGSNLRQYRTALRSLTNSSHGVNASNAGALFAGTLEANSKLHNAENMRRDAYNEAYSQRADRINELNSEAFAKASDLQRDLENNKNVTLPLQARNAWLQGQMANEQVKAQQRADRVRMALAIASNDQNGVMTRFLKNYNNGGKEKLQDLLKGYGFGQDN